MLKKLSFFFFFTLIMSSLSAQIIIRDTVYVKKIIYDTVGVYDTTKRIQIDKLHVSKRIDTSLNAIRIPQIIPITPRLHTNYRQSNSAIKLSYSLFTSNIQNMQDIDIYQLFHHVALGYEYSYKKWIFGVDIGYNEIQNSTNSKYTYVSFSREQYVDDDTLNQYLRPYLTKTNQNIYSTFSLLEIPISIKYKFFDSKFHLIPSLDLNTSITLKNTVFIYDSIQNELTFLDNDINTLSFSLRTGLGLAYQINNNMLIALEPYVNLGLSSFINSDIYFRYALNRYGINLYYTYHF